MNSCQNNTNIWCANDRVGAGNILGACPRKENYEHKQKMKSSSSPSSDTCTGTTTIDGTKYNVTIYNCDGPGTKYYNSCVLDCIQGGYEITDNNVYCTFQSDSVHSGPVCTPP